jgi:hypothetical protein
VIIEHANPILGQRVDVGSRNFTSVAADITESLTVSGAVVTAVRMGGYRSVCAVMVVRRTECLLSRSVM